MEKLQKTYLVDTFFTNYRHIIIYRNAYFLNYNILDENDNLVKQITTLRLRIIVSSKATLAQYFWKKI
jgi:hypothetical protein